MPPSLCFVAYAIAPIPFTVLITAPGILTMTPRPILLCGTSGAACAVSAVNGTSVLSSKTTEINIEITR